jgi:hypothetical protein
MVMRFKWKIISIPLEIVLILTQDRCTVYDEHAASRSFCEHSMGLEGGVGQVEACFCLLRDSVNLDAR